MISFSFVSLLSAIISFIAIIIVFNIFRRVYEEDYKKPWLYIAFSTIFLVSSQLISFFTDFFGFYIVNNLITDGVIYILNFISITVLTYALFLELLILKYYKGRFVKMKFIPIQEGTLGGDINLNVESGVSYISFKQDRNFIFNQFSEAVKKGFEGFLVVEENPRELRTKFGLTKTPIAWISQIDSGMNSNYLKDSLDSNSDVIDPLHLNNLINYVDNFLDQSQNSFIILDLNLLIRTNNFSIFIEFLKYVASKSEKYNGILIAVLNTDILKSDQINELKSFLKELEIQG